MAVRDDDGSGMTERQLRDEVMTLILAGHEVTAVLLSWSFSLIARRPEVEARLLAEAEEVLGGRLPTAADVPALRYTQMVLQAALRLYPPAWLLGREAVEEVAVGGHTLPRGGIALISPWVLHRDARFFPDPEAFRPERWEGDRVQQLPRFAFLPFGGGPRICIGNQFVMMEATLILAAVMQRFRLIPVEERMPEPEPLITLRPRGAVHMSLAAR